MYAFSAPQGLIQESVAADAIRLWSIGFLQSEPPTPKMAWERGLRSARSGGSIGRGGINSALRLPRHACRACRSAGILAAPPGFSSSVENEVHGDLRRLLQLRFFLNPPWRDPAGPPRAEETAWQLQRSPVSSGASFIM